MTDAKLRELERRWTETGLATDEAAFLRERVRSNLLSNAMLSLAAYCGHTGAKLASSEAVETPNIWQLWLYGLERWGRGTVVRAAVAAARSVVHIVERELPGLAHTPLRQLKQAEEWICSGGTVSNVHSNQGSWPDDASAEAMSAAEAALEARRSVVAGVAGAAAALANALDAAGSEAPIEAVKRELIDYALGYTDPVRSRVQQ